MAQDKQIDRIKEWEKQRDEPKEWTGMNAPHIAPNVIRNNPQIDNWIEYNEKMSRQNP